MSRSSASHFGYRHLLQFIDSQTERLSTSAMNRVFDTTTATYKFYWLLALLDMHVKEQMDEMLALDVAARMVAYA